MAGTVHSTSCSPPDACILTQKTERFNYLLIYYEGTHSRVREVESWGWECAGLLFHRNQLSREQKKWGSKPHEYLEETCLGRGGRVKVLSWWHAWHTWRMKKGGMVRRTGWWIHRRHDQTTQDLTGIYKDLHLYHSPNNAIIQISVSPVDAISEMGSKYKCLYKPSHHEELLKQPLNILLPWACLSQVL